MIFVLGYTILKQLISLFYPVVYFPFCQTDLSGAFELYQISDVSWSNHSLSKVTTSRIIKRSGKR